MDRGQSDKDDHLNILFDRAQIVPVSVSYELDPCALRKAHELSVIEQLGHYDKSDEEDVQSIVIGLVGRKGRVHLHFGEPMRGRFDSAEAAAQALDVAILSGMRVFPTHVEAARRLGDKYTEPSQVPSVDKTMQRHARQIDSCPASEQKILLQQYANLIRNRIALGVERPQLEESQEPVRV